ncbi:bifunctional riboflavin kinase/FAD synthetase [Polycladidibacter stylochi]|uniref:bifunctional riboflavin kinase/FAD synthetase n=1 Tax=Polycladidibacter stylochi TaxID=1807766 RepID=UPI0008304BED|nr:bifunctional riboflavin kinase/FAD synthetase [Pseudovibrio stylochi]
MTQWHPVSQRFHIVEELAQFPAQLRGGVVAIGNFDGVHRAHQAILQQTLQLARTYKVPALALSFEPHPRSFFQPDKPVSRLSPAAQKGEIMKALGLDALIQLPFNAQLASLSAEDFVRQILVDALGITHSVTGYDFHFGKARRGTPEFLRGAGAAQGFSVVIAPAERDEGGAVISSSRIREALRCGNVIEANALLGYRYYVDACVQHGDKRGRLLGYPTANLQIDPHSVLKEGIYAVRVAVDGLIHDGVASYGRRPTFVDGQPLLEVHLFDFDGDLYDKNLRVSFAGYLRGEMKFDGPEALIQQMDLDSAQARAILDSLRPLSPLDNSLATQLHFE